MNAVALMPEDLWVVTSTLDTTYVALMDQAREAHARRHLITARALYRTAAHLAGQIAKRCEIDDNLGAASCWEGTKQCALDDARRVR